MITGYNTDIKHEAKVYHVQTEDKGLDNPYIESLIYVGGEILASKRTSYNELVTQGIDDKAISEMMEMQHRKMIAAIKRGRFDDLKKAVAPKPPPLQGAMPAPPKREETLLAAPLPTLPNPESLNLEILSGKMPKEASDRTLDQVIIDYLASEAETERLELTLLTHPEFHSGQNVEIRLQAKTTLTQKPVVGAEVIVRIISTTEKANQVFKGKTTGDGLLAVRFDIPEFKEGNAAVIITGSSQFGSDEIKQLVKRRR